MKFGIVKLLMLTSLFIFYGCSEKENKKEDVKTYSVSGYVLDGNVGDSRVCFDLNSDNQCTTSDEYVTTNSEGYYEIIYEEETTIEQYQIIFSKNNYKCPCNFDFLKKVFV